MRLIPRQARPDPGMLLIRSVCHELRPPMATLAGLVQALEKAPSEPRRAELTRLAAEHVAYAEAILGQASETVWGLSGSAAEPVPLARILPAVAATAPAGAVRISAGRAALRWPVHPGHTQQILINLVGNAVRHGSGPVRLAVQARPRRLRLTVADAGGPTPQLRRRSAPPGERGLGLWVVRRLLGGLGGSVRSRKLAPAGLAMEVLLPRYRG
ncbi:ATP-binding protein [Actinoplanes missouriensis]|uniref:sensor histidine kinase n=1 Tax=Actinoplanes missouriensis TaxID=1866 RepID=UPI00340FDD5F